MADDIGVIITTQRDLQMGMAALIEIEPRFATVYQHTGPLPLRRTDDGFAAVLKAIMGQQVSVASARAIWSRLEQAGATDAKILRRIDHDDLRGLGLSRQKANYARALADADIDYVALRNCPTGDVIKTLVAIKGIGPWTAEIYTMFALGRADVFAAGDLALQESARLIFDLDQRPTPRILAGMANAWSPWRAVAARLLWAYYAVHKQREGIAT